jgi:ABC-type Fe3+-siderophore transport system permease subunit
MEPSINPFAALSLIVAPAILTNASAVLAMSTSNRLARAVDRARELLRQAEAGDAGAERSRHLRDLGITQERAVMLLRVLRSFYVALAGFALATLIALIGAAVAPTAPRPFVLGVELLGLAAGVVAVSALTHGAVVLVRETRMAVAHMQERIAQARAALRQE